VWLSHKGAQQPRVDPVAPECCWSRQAALRLVVGTLRRISKKRPTPRPDTGGPGEQPPPRPRDPPNARDQRYCVEGRAREGDEWQLIETYSKRQDANDAAQALIGRAPFRQARVTRDGKQLGYWQSLGFDFVLAAVAQARAERAALDAVRRAGDAATRDERRSLLQAELERRGLAKAPLWIESKLDTLESGYKAPGTIGALAALGKIVADGVDTFKQGRSPGVGDPAWMAPPPPAQYDVLLAIGKRVGVELDPDVRDWLDRAHAAASYRIGPTVTIKVWLNWAGDAHAPQQSLAVAIGSRRVGVLTATPPFVDLMGQAASVDKLPVVYGHLTKRATAPLFLLEISTPVGSPPR
jgi:hypothetical protein